MLRSLPGADPAIERDGLCLVKRVLELFHQCVPKAQRNRVTIALGQVDNVELAVVYHTDLKKADRIAGKLNKIGVAANGTSGEDHAEMALYCQNPSVRAIGISNPYGPCPGCQRFFENTPYSFANLYWDSEGWVER